MNDKPRQDSTRALAGCLMGTAVGDALGLPMEGVSARRQRRLFTGPLRPRLIGGRAMVSDDTEHTLMVAQALLEAPADAELFATVLARKLRWWLISLPAGVGFATLRAILKLWLGVSPKRSGVYSAGNGPAMRSAILGVYFQDAPDSRRRYIAASARLTHCDPRAEIAAQAVGETAARLGSGYLDLGEWVASLRSLSELAEWRELVAKIEIALKSSQDTAAFAATIGAAAAVSGYAFRSVTIALYAAVRNQTNLRGALQEAIACGGDTDTVAAIAGGLVGTAVGEEGIPPEWRSRICDWPRSMRLLSRVAARLSEQRAEGRPLGAVHYCWPAVPLRNLAFLTVVVGHGFRRLLPPY